MCGPSSVLFFFAIALLLACSVCYEELIPPDAFGKEPPGFAKDCLGKGSGMCQVFDKKMNCHCKFLAGGEERCNCRYRPEDNDWDLLRNQ